jgi:hypothetical protein
MNGFQMTATMVEQRRTQLEGEARHHDRGFPASARSGRRRSLAPWRLLAGRSPFRPVTGSTPVPTLAAQGNGLSTAGSH